MFNNFFLNDPYREITEEEKKANEEAELLVKKNIRDFAQEAKSLFQDERYTKLKKEFSKIYEQNIRLLIYYNEPTGNVDKYALKMRELQIQLRTLEQIFNTPEGFVKSEEKLNVNKSERVKKRSSEAAESHSGLEL